MKPVWISKLEDRWKLKSGWQVLVILIVFACTGFTALFLKNFILQFLFGTHKISGTQNLIYYVFILTPVYNVLLLTYGFLFGQFSFFWKFEKRFFKRIFSFFRRNDNPE